MPKYYEFKVAGYYLYFTSHCIIECMHVHAKGTLNDRETRKIQIVISTKTGCEQLTEREKCGIIFRQKSYMLMWLNGRAFHS